MDESAVASVFRALADPTRRRILQALRKGELAAGDIASRFPISGPSVSRHLAVLKAAGRAPIAQPPGMLTIALPRLASNGPSTQMLARMVLTMS